MTVSPTSLGPAPSKLASVVKPSSTSSPSTQTYKHSPRLGRGASAENQSALASGISTSVSSATSYCGSKTTLTQGHRSRHNSVKKSETTELEQGGPNCTDALIDDDHSTWTA